MTRCVALIRGINVGRAKRIAMAELRALVERLGYGDVSTLLNSGNVVFDAPRPQKARLAQAIEAGIVDTFGISARVVVVGAADLDVIVSDNPLRKIANDPSRYMVAFVADLQALAKAQPLLAENWSPEAFAIGTKAAYLWYGGGVIDSKLAKAVGRVMGDAMTTRNWATVMKLHAAIRGR